MRIPLPVLSLVLLTLTGCSALDITPSSPLAIEAGAIHGAAHGGLQPITGAKVYLLEATYAGYGGASKSLLTAATGSVADTIGYSVLTDGSGAFSISGDYTCDAGAVVYALVLGGNAGAGINTNTGLMTTLGTCPAAAPFNFAATVPFLYISELTTVATAYSLAGYMTDATHLAGSANPLARVGLKNAAATFKNLVSVGSGRALAVSPTNASSIVPQPLLDSLGNILAACVNTTDKARATCATLFANTLAGGATGAQPTETATAAINLAHNPFVSAARVSALYGLEAGIGAPYAPHLSAAPRDFVVGIVYFGSDALGSYEGPVLNAAGDVWLTSGSVAGRIGALHADGSSATTSGTFGAGSTGLIYGAFDPNNVFWGGNGTSVQAFDSTGTQRTGSPYAPTGLFSITGLAADPNGGAWVTSNDGTVNATTTVLSHYLANGALAAGAPYTGNGMRRSGALALDRTGSVWVANELATLSKFTPAGAAAGFGTADGCDSPANLALDATGTFWIQSYYQSCETSAAGVAGANSPHADGTFSVHDLLLDGASHAYVLNGTASLVEFGSDGSTLNAAGLGSAALSNYAGSDAERMAADGSGNLWVTGATSGTAYAVTQLVGLVAPVATPKVANLLAPYGTAEVNRP